MTRSPTSHAAWLGFVVALHAAETHAHLLPAAGIRPFVVDGALIAAGTTWGVISRTEEGSFVRVCEEALGTPHAFARRTDGAWLLGRAGPGLVTAEDGCAPAAPAGVLADHVVTALEVAATAPHPIFAATATPGLANGIFVSRDGGFSFAPFGALAPGRLIQSLAVSDSGSLVASQGFDTTTATRFLEITNTITETSTSPWSELSAATDIRLLEIDKEDRIWVGASTAAGEYQLARLGAQDSSLEVVATFDGPVLDFIDGTDFWLALVRSSAAGVGVYRASADAGFVRVDGGPTTCLLRVAGDTRVWGCGQQTDAAHFFVSEDGRTWLPVLPFDAVQDTCCAVGSAGAAACARYLVESTDGGVCAPPAEARSDGGEDAPVVPRCACVRSDQGRAALDARWPVALLCLVAGLVRPRGSRRRAHSTSCPRASERPTS